jgi:5-methyltetrahydrofolate--homocysteine methyltransferase
VVNLGIKVPPDQLIRATREHKPDIIGLSGLLVKSAQEMVTTADDLSKAGSSVPILVGGAALSRNFVDKRIAPRYDGTVAYAKDAMDGLGLAKRIVDSDAKSILDEELQARRLKLAKEVPDKKPVPQAPARRSTMVSLVEEPPPVADFENHVLANTPLEHIWSFINPLMLYGRHLGLKGQMLPEQGELAQTEAGQKALEIWESVEEVKKAHRETLQAKALFRFFKAESEGNILHVLDGKGTHLESIEFPRQPRTDGLCLADYCNPVGTVMDNIAVTVTTCGTNVRELAEELKQSGNYLHSHIVQALALETAEAYAELLHAKLRSMWGYPDAPTMTMLERFQARYHGKRYSFGYPSCPDLEGQAILFRLVDGGSIGVSLTDGFMMDPEASTSAIVFHHPEAKYFALKPEKATTNDDSSRAEA